MNIFFRLKIKSKISVLFLIFILECLFTSAVSAQVLKDQDITLKVQNAKVENVFSRLSQITNYKFSYNQEEISTYSRVTLNVKNVTLNALLSEITTQTKLYFQRNNNIILVKTKPITNVSSKFKTFSGKIVDEEGIEILGAGIVVEGTSNGAVSDMNGNFELKHVSEGAKILVSYIGYKKLTLSANAESLSKIVLKEDTRMLGEVVVTALNIKRSEKALGYSVQKISNESIQRVKGLDIATSLTGKVSGLLVKNSTDFATAPTVLIRGESPLIVIDGIPYANMTLRDIVADDIESMSVLKGATASALYGNRGASGAIMIITKNGKENKSPLSISLTSNSMTSAGFVAIPEKQSMYGRGTNNIYSVNSASSWGAALDGTIREQWDPELQEYREYAYTAVGKNNFKNFINNAYVTNNTLSVAYKGDNSSIRMSTNWTENKGLYPNSKYDKYSFSLAGDVNYKKLKLTANAAYHKQTSDNIGFNGYTSYDPMYTLLIWTAADYDIRDYKDNYWMTPDVQQNFTYQNTHNNPYFDRNERTKGIDRNIFNTSLSLDYEILPWLKASLRSGLDFYSNKEDLQISQGSYVTSGNTSAFGAGAWSGKNTGLYATGTNSGYSMNNDLIITANKTFFDDLKVDALLGGTIFYKQDQTISGSTENGLSVPGFYSLNASVDPASINSSIYKKQVNSIYGRLALSWKNLIYADGTLRNDWSSTLSKENRSYLYPSVSGSFIVSELLPKSTRDWLDLWKIRSSWTVSKNTPNIYEINTNYNVTNSSWGTLSSASLSKALSEGSVNPEAASTFEIGTQLHFLKNKFMLDVTYYDKLMYDFIVNGQLSSASGFTSNLVNSDEEISRRGWEVSMTANIIENKDWNWNMNLSWSKYARYYNKLDEEYSSKNPWVKKGARVDAYYLKDYAKDSDGNQIYSNGRIQFNPYNSLYGNYDPDWIWGLSTNVSYKNFTLAVSFDGRVGGLTNSMTESYLWVSGSHPDSITEERAADVATPGSTNFLGDGVKVVSGKVTYDKYGTVLSDDRVFAPNDVYTTYNRYIQDLHSGIAWGGNGRPADCYSTTFVKLREVSLSYKLPSKWLKGCAQSASIAFVGQNLWMWAKDFKYSDPDGGTDNFNDPSVRYLGMNLKINF